MRRFASRLLIAFLISATFVATASIVIESSTWTTGHYSVQEQERVIEKSSWRNEPIKITKIKVGGVARSLSQKFSEEGNWFRDFSVELNNVSDKPIVFVNLNIVFAKPEYHKSSTPLAGSPYSFSLKYGQDPDSDFGTSKSQETVKPGGVISLTLSDKEYQMINNALSELNYSVASVKELRLVFGRIVFEDGTVWSGGSLFRPDASKPYGYSPIEQPPSKLIPTTPNTLGQVPAGEEGFRLFLRLASCPNKVIAEERLNLLSDAEPLIRELIPVRDAKLKRLTLLMD